jgi:hypothetical protein
MGSFGKKELLAQAASSADPTPLATRLSCMNYSVVKELPGAAKETNSSRVDTSIHYGQAAARLRISLKQ